MPPRDKREIVRVRFKVATSNFSSPSPPALVHFVRASNPLRRDRFEIVVRFVDTGRWREREKSKSGSVIGFGVVVVSFVSERR